jgi:sodium-dependent dicarboxylate transporter 2/3/5
MSTTDDSPGTRVDVERALPGGTTYRSLGEQHLSPAEERFERGRRTWGLLLAPAVTLIFLALPLDIPAGRTRDLGGTADTAGAVRALVAHPRDG